MFSFDVYALGLLEVIALSGIMAMCTLSIATTIGVSVAYLATREPRAVRQAAPVRGAQTDIIPANSPPVAA